MKHILLQMLSIICLYASCKSQSDKQDSGLRISYPAENDATIDIDSIYLKLAVGKPLDYRKVGGQFIYPENNGKEAGKVLALFISDEIRSVINYTGYSDNRDDQISFNAKKFAIKSKLDPASVSLYQCSTDAKKYLVFIGKAQSASGTGMQVTYFILIHLDKNGQLANYYEFESRFGDINSLVDYNSDGRLDYFKIANEKNMDEYVLTVNNIESQNQIGQSRMLLKYALNEKFVILEDQLSVRK